MGTIPENLEQRAKEILVERLFLDIEPQELTLSESLTESQGVDSVRLFDMVVGLEADFDISFEDEELLLENFDTVASIITRVSAKIAKK